jgi:hypothetical protein
MIYFPVILLMLITLGGNIEAMVVGQLWSSSCCSIVIVCHYQGLALYQFLYSG